MRLRSDLRSRLLVLVIAAILPSVLALGYLLYDLRSDRRDRLAEEAVRHAELVNLDMRSVMEGARQLGYAITHFSDVQNLDAGCVSVLRGLRADLPAYVALSVLRADGRVVCSTDPQHDAADPQRLAELARVANEDRLHVGLYTDRSNRNGPTIPFCLGFAAVGGQRAVVVMELGLDWLAAHIALLPLPPRSTVGIADRQGTTLVRVPDQQRFVGRKLPVSVLALLRGERRGNAELIGFDGRERLVGYVPIGVPGQDVFVSIGLYLPELLADINAAAWQGLILIGIGAALSLWLTMLAGERIVRRPTAALLDAAQSWSAGDLGARAHLAAARGSEFDRLAVAFNAMAETLGRRRDELEELNTTLEARVQARTRDLVDSRNRLQIEIIERERTEAELRQAQKLQAVGQLAGGIAHDFNNLLTAIVGALDLLRRRLPADQDSLGPLIENAFGAAERGGRLTVQLLAFSRRQRLLPVPTDLNVSVIALTGLLGSTLGRNIRIETDLAADLAPAMVDPNQVEAMILNLAINGRDAMEDGGVLTLQTRNISLPPKRAKFGNAMAGDYIALTVADTGKGMRQDVMARAFEPFFTTKPLGQGSGLGLSQVHGLAVQSGGDVRIESRPGRGTSVTVLLPRAGSPALRREDASVVPLPALRSLRVLVADDDRAVREMTGEMLAERGHVAVLARDAVEALGILERSRDRPEHGFDALLADYVMPGMNGVTLIRAAQAMCPGLRALLVTGNAEFQAAEAIRPEDIMRKPFTIAQLEERLGRVVESAPLDQHLPRDRA